MSERIESVEYYQGLGWGKRAKAFREFMLQCDKACEDAIGLSIMDLPDQDFASAFEDEQDPAEFVADIIIEEIGDML
jgi:hypothetical protein